MKPLPAAKHIFSHVEWHMIGYEVLVDELEREMKADVLFASLEELEEKYPMPSAFEPYMPAVCYCRLNRPAGIIFPYSQFRVRTVTAA